MRSNSALATPSQKTSGASLPRALVSPSEQLESGMFASEGHSRVTGDTTCRYKSSDLLIHHLPEGQEWTQGLRMQGWFFICFFRQFIHREPNSKVQWHRQGKEAPPSHPSPSVPTSKAATVTSFLGDLGEDLCLQ